MYLYTIFATAKFYPYLLMRQGSQAALSHNYFLFDATYYLFCLPAIDHNMFAPSMSHLRSDVFGTAWLTVIKRKIKCSQIAYFKTLAHVIEILIFKSFIGNDDDFLYCQVKHYLLFFAP